MTAERRAELLASFEEFYRPYPRHLARAAAEKAWLKLQPERILVDQIVAAVAEQKTWSHWLKDDGQYIPYPATWLTHHRWTDERPRPLAAHAPVSKRYVP